MSSNTISGTKETETIPLYPTLQLPESDDQSPLDTNSEISLNKDLRILIDNFIIAWETLVDLQKSYTEGTSTLVTQLKTVRRETYNAVVNALFTYVYAYYKNQLGTPTYKKQLLTQEHITSSQQAIKKNLIESKGKYTLFENLLIELGILDNKNREFTTKVLFILKRETLTREIRYQKQIKELEYKFTEVDTIATIHSIRLKQFSDDTQGYVDFQLGPHHQSEALNALSACAANIEDWFTVKKKRNNKASTTRYEDEVWIQCIFTRCPFNQECSTRRCHRIN